MILTSFFLVGFLSPLASHGQSMNTKADVQALASSPQWLTTKVYIEGHPEVDVKDKYPGVVGISMWDPMRNRYECFYADTGQSKYDHGGGGYVLVTGDQKNHILLPDKGPIRTVVRRLETLNNAECTYSRDGSRELDETNETVDTNVVQVP
uniref:DUF4822 domain-containing protein n=1 Tax=Pseudomonas paraveronii TaxID=3040598 RepID=UPI003CC69007